MHENKHISHHDIKLHNILISSHNTVKLCDFGISQVLQGKTDENIDMQTSGDVFDGMSDDSVKQHVGGSIPYMSPQLLYCSFHPDHRYDMFAADMWAFGVTLYILLTGKYPFSGHDRESLYNNQKMVYEISELNFKTPLSIFRDLPKDVPEDLKHVLTRCLEHLEHRRGTASELYEYMKSEMDAAGPLQKSISNPLPIIRIPRTLSHKSSLRTIHGLTTLSSSLLTLKTKH